MDKPSECFEATEANKAAKDAKTIADVPMSATVTLGVRSEDALQIRNSQMLAQLVYFLETKTDYRSENVSVSEEDFRSELSAPPPPLPVLVPVTKTIDKIVPERFKG